MMITLQMLSDTGINPFAVELLTKSFEKRAAPGEEVTFGYGRTVITLKRMPEGEQAEGDPNR